jgi:tetratricopeptide (TPR) repeat protein
MKRPAALRNALLSLRSPVAATREAALDAISALARLDMVDVRSAQPALVLLLARGSAAEQQRALQIFEYRADMGADVGIAVPVLLRLQREADARTRSLAQRALRYANKRLGGLLTAELPSSPPSDDQPHSDDQAPSAEAPAPSEAALLSETQLFDRAVELYYQQRQGQKAEALLAEATRRFPENADLANIRGTNLAWGLGRHRDALPHLERAVELDVRSASHACTLAWCLLWLGELEQGREQARRSLKCKKELSDEVRLASQLYLYLCGEPDERPKLLTALAKLIHAGARVSDWTVEGLLEQARRADHPEAPRLAQLAKVAFDQAPAKSLEDWPAWQAARRKGR